MARILEMFAAPAKRKFLRKLSITFTPRAQQVLALARREADRFHHNFVGTEHLLLGLIRLGQGVAVSVLAKLGLDLETVWIEVEKPPSATKFTAPKVTIMWSFTEMRFSRTRKIYL